MGLFSLLFPKYCVSCRKMGNYLCDACFARLSFDVSYICLLCDRFTVDGMTHPVCKTKYGVDGSFSALTYNRVSKKLLYSFKYKPYVTDINNILVDLFYEGIIQNQGFIAAIKQPIALVPIPLHKVKLRNRGYNQSQLLAVGLSKKIGAPCINALVRVKKTDSQVGKKKKDRQKNIEGAFALKKECVQTVYGRTIFLVDDVLTSGATFQEAAKVLKMGGAKKVYGLSLFRD